MTSGLGKLRPTAQDRSVQARAVFPSPRCGCRSTPRRASSVELTFVTRSGQRLAARAAPGFFPRSPRVPDSSSSLRCRAPTAPWSWAAATRPQWELGMPRSAAGSLLVSDSGPAARVDRDWSGAVAQALSHAPAVRRRRVCRARGRVKRRAVRGPSGSYRLAFDRPVAVGRGDRTRRFLASSGPGRRLDDRASSESMRSAARGTGDLLHRRRRRQPMLPHKGRRGRVPPSNRSPSQGAYDPAAVPSVSSPLTSPDIAWCGMTEAERQEHGRKSRSRASPGPRRGSRDPGP